MFTKIDRELYELDDAICRHINNISRDPRDVVAQDVLSDLRHFTEHVMLKIYFDGRDLEISYENIEKAKKYIYSNGSYRFLTRFYKMLQRVVSHYKPTKNASERLLLKYYHYLIRIRSLLKKKYNLELLHNLETFPLDLDSGYEEYYKKIAEKIDLSVPSNVSNNRYYIHKIKPFSINNNIYYEVTFYPANDYSSKADRVIGFTKIPIESNYAAKMSFINSSIDIMGCKTHIIIITGWQVAIRDCEFSNFLKLVTGKDINRNHLETRYICDFLTKTKFNLLDIIDFHDLEYQTFKNNLPPKAKVTNFFNVLDICRDIIRNEKPGKNVLRYLLFKMNNIIIKKQYNRFQNKKLSKLFLKNKVIPFEEMPFAFSLANHNPPFSYLINCFDTKNREPEILARYVINNTETNGNLFTPLKDINIPEDKLISLVEAYNNGLWHKHRPDRELKIDKKHIFVKKYVENCNFIINELTEISSHGVPNYADLIRDWLNQPGNRVDSEEKKEVLSKMFIDSKVAMIYGAAGTGKTTLINHVSNLFFDQRKLFLAQTNTAINNLKQKIDDHTSNFMTIARYISSKLYTPKFDILIIDECSTVSNYDMKKILEKASFNLLILVGDTYQIKSIRFGNWFCFAKELLPKESLIELSKPYRTNDKKLIEFWDAVRKMDDTVLEISTKQQYSKNIDSSIFEKFDKDEVILCLNYDGLYGVNNVNRFLQERNPAKPIYWGVQTFKIGDPILFNDTNRFGPVIYNNLKGKILNVFIQYKGDINERIVFDIMLDKIINKTDIINDELKLLEPGLYNYVNNSVIRFVVDKTKSFDQDDLDSRTTIPFQISYAVSIHKSQGLEYNSVKIVITNEIEEMISHDIFYTAITRTKKHLKIYWSPEVENKIISNLKPKNNKKDLNLLRQISIE